MNKTATVTVYESMPGTWRVNGSGPDGVVQLYSQAGEPYYTCSFHGRGLRCLHVAALEAHPRVSRCEWAEEPCSEVACTTLRIDGAPTPLCPEHYQQVRDLG